MPADFTEDEWGSRRTAIQSLYIAENRDLQGPGGVMQEMSAKYGFSATKAQYERQFEKWGFPSKYKKDQDDTAPKLMKRKQDNKESEVGIDDEILPPEKLRKYVSRNGHDAVSPYESRAPTPDIPEETHSCSPPASAAPEIPAPNYLAAQLHSTMQRDIDLTIGDVVYDFKYHSLSALSQISEHIIPQETHTNLRFLKIPHLKQYGDLGSEMTCTLTEKGEYPTEKRYVAVSYSWDSFSNPDNGDSSPFPPSPRVLVKQGDEPLRAPRCPPKVLLRAIAFAISMNLSLIWIDQECVDQGDPADIQTHLQCNHIIFSQAEHQIGLLNFRLTKTQVDVLFDIDCFHLTAQAVAEAEFDKAALFAGDGMKLLLRRIQSTARLFRCIARDRWFTRTWVFQERFSANVDMHLLLPVSTEALNLLNKHSKSNLIGEDFPLMIGKICSVAAVIRTMLSDPALQKLLEEDITFRDATFEALNSLHEAAQVLSGPVFAGTPFDRVCETLKSGPGSIDINKISNLRLHRTFLDMESCDNRFVSDRLAILSNIMHFEKRFPPTSFHSYSFALVALLSANSHLPSVIVRKANPTPASQIFSHSVSASGLLMLAYHIKELITEGNQELQAEFDNVSDTLTKFFGRDITRHTAFIDAVQDAVESDLETSLEELLLLLSRMTIVNLQRRDVVPLNATIEQLLGGIVAEDHVDNVGLKYSHGETIVKYGIQTNQLEGDTFIAFAGAYRWRSDFIERYYF